MEFVNEYGIEQVGYIMIKERCLCLTFLKNNAAN